VSTSTSCVDMSAPDVANIFGEIEVVSLALESRRLVLALDLAERRLVFSTKSERDSGIAEESVSGMASTESSSTFGPDVPRGIRVLLAGYVASPSSVSFLFRFVAPERLFRGLGLSLTSRAATAATVLTVGAIG